MDDISTSARHRDWKKAFAWLDSDNIAADRRAMLPGQPVSECDRWVPFVFLHAGCFSVIWAGVSSTAVILCAILYCLRMFAITAFYHRYFSHRSFKTSRLAQLLFALIGSMSMQRGPLWWAAHHRHHHASSDEVDDVHSPVIRGFIWSHIAWITSTKNMLTHYDRVSDFSHFPELHFINRFDWLMPATLLISLWFTGEALRQQQPALHTTGLQLVAWGFFISTTLLFHATSSVNSFAHLFGYRRFETSDGSRNNPLVALFTFGEGWHNNHHKFKSSARAGFTWWEIDITFYGLKLLELLGIIRDLKAMPRTVAGKIEITHSTRSDGAKVL